MNKPFQCIPEYNKGKKGVHKLITKELYPDEKYGIKHKAVKQFPGDECPKIENENICNSFENFCNWDDRQCKFKDNYYKGLMKFATDYQVVKNSFDELYGYISEIVREIFQLSNKFKVKSWDDFLKHYQNNKNNHCGYNYFRKLVIDMLIIIIIKEIFNINNNNSYKIYKNGKEIYKSNLIEGEYIKVYFDMVGSEDVTSDYDLTIYSNPETLFLYSINTILNFAFLDINNGELNLQKIFDTNIYSHPMYLYLRTKPTTDEYFLSLSDIKYFINPARYFSNEIVFTNLLFFETTDNYNIINSFNNSVSNIFELNSQFNINGNPLVNENGINLNIWYQGDTTYDNFLIQKEDSHEGDSHEEQSKIPKRRRSSGLSICETEEFTLDCKKYIHTKIDDINSAIFELLHTNDFEKNTENINEYVSLMRLALWYADETYHTFSAYFHVIHCCVLHESSKECITKLLSNDRREDFKKICIVSALENFAFMFHYMHIKDVKYFKKKIAKYLARISHAIAIIEYIDKHNETQIETLENIVNSSLGNHDYVTAKYKRDDNTKQFNNSNPGLFTNEFMIKFEYENKNSQKILELIYSTLIKSKFIKPEYLCITLRKMSESQVGGKSRKLRKLTKKRKNRIK